LWYQSGVTGPNTGAPEPIELLGRWLEEAERADIPAPRAMTLATCSAEGNPSARVIGLKQLDRDGLVFTTALWTRKVAEMRANPHVAAAFFWPSLGRQVRVEGSATIATRELAEKLFADRPRSHQLQTLVSRQGEEISDLGSLRAKLAQIERELGDRPVPCPKDWGAVRIAVERIEFWREDGDRMHSRLLCERSGEDWRQSLLSP
jgi:pyridoxamine 5'-phosphate oxidase